MIQYHGWADSAIAPTNSIDYCNEVKKGIGDNNGTGNYKEIQQVYRLFSAGAAHGRKITASDEKFGDCRCNDDSDIEV